MNRDERGVPAILRRVLAANAGYADRFTGGSLSKRPKLRTAVLACMDARLDPLSFLGLDDGDVHVIRNAGGRVTPDAIRSIVISQWLLGTRDVVVVHHTDCGLIGETNASIRKRINAVATANVDHVDFRPIADLETSLNEDVATLRRSQIVRRDARLAGLIYDVRSGRLLCPPARRT